MAALELKSGGRLGVVVLDGGQRILGHRPDERFAMCSTFKLLLAGMVLDGQARGQLKLGDLLPLTAKDLVFNSPVAEQRLAAGRISIGEAARAAVTVSDNAAANLLLRRLGGPAALTGWLRSHGDRVTRLDRYEPILNENAKGDPRDTTTVAAMAATSHALVFGDWLPAAERATLRDWLLASTTGTKRIRAGLPAGWVVGDKTGTCGGNAPSYNDIAFVFPEPGKRGGNTIAVYLDSPRVEGDAASAVIAGSARLASGLIAAR